MSLSLNLKFLHFFLAARTSKFVFLHTNLYTATSFRSLRSEGKLWQIPISSAEISEVRSGSELNMFVAFINDLPDCILSTCNMFAGRCQGL